MSNSVIEPLRADIGSGTDVVNSADEIIATCCSKDVARRIVACVNACVGVSTKDLECWAQGQYDKNGFGYIGRLVRLTTHRDKLLDALDDALKMIPCGTFDDYHLRLLATDSHLSANAILRYRELIYRIKTGESTMKGGAA